MLPTLDGTTFQEWFLLVHHLDQNVATSSELHPYNMDPKVPEKVRKFHPSTGPDLPPQLETLSSNVDLVHVDVVVIHPEETPLHFITSYDHIPM